MYTSIKGTHWWCDFRWTSAKETIKTLRSQKQKDIWSWFCACTFISIKVINWLFKFRWVWSYMPREAQREVLSLTNSNKIYFIRNKIKYCFRLPMLGSIKFLAWSIKLKTSYGILSSLKLTTLYLICNCQISSISVLFLYFKLLCCLGITY